jgi:hypothetical protein
MSPEIDLIQMGEDKITLEIVDVLAKIQYEESNTREDTGFSQARFETTRPQSQAKSTPGSELEYRQFDFIITPTGAFKGGTKTLYGLFVECKCLRGNISRALREYVVNGIHRFVCQGDYAQYMPHAMMLGYAETAFMLPYSLENYFKKSRTKKIKQCKPIEIRSFSDNLTTVTNHNRCFTLPDGSEPGPIDLHHLWLFYKPRIKN